ncbi:MAG: hypothetical protein B6240_11760 [Desulfobacteraceae bacterium 4572_87]|nr:MAG: hypothetical protein B6240_11760 [Desulfobacteraceae bacterium 4572_87]
MIEAGFLHAPTWEQLEDDGLTSFPIDAHNMRINKVSIQSMQGVFMRKVRVNITMDEDLSKFLKGFSLSQRLSMSELINQWVLGLKRAQENQGMQTVLSSPEFYRSLLTTLEKTRTGEMKWHSREDVF